MVQLLEMGKSIPSLGRMITDNLTESTHSTTKVSHTFLENVGRLMVQPMVSFHLTQLINQQKLQVKCQNL